MRFPKLTTLLPSLSLIILISCTNTDEVERENIYYGTITMTGAQETPPVTTSATGTIDANYNRLTKTLSYKVTFSGLSGNATMAHIHGLGEPGISAPALQTFPFPPSGSFPAAKSGTYSGSLLIDGVKFTEEYLLGGRYYINIHTAANTAGEIRGQLILAKK